MPGPVVTMGGTVTCMHGGQSIASTTAAKLMLGGQPAITIPASYSVAGCAFPPPPVANGPCVTGMIMSGSTKVTTSGMPVLLALPPMNGTCVPTGTPMMIANAGQTKVIAQ